MYDTQYSVSFYIKCIINSTYLLTYLSYHSVGMLLQKNITILQSLQLWYTTNLTNAELSVYTIIATFSTKMPKLLNTENKLYYKNLIWSHFFGQICERKFSRTLHKGTLSPGNFKVSSPRPRSSRTGRGQILKVLELRGRGGDRF